MFERWWSRTARIEYLGFADGQPGSEVTFYYDPGIDHHRLPVGWAGLFPAYFLAPQKPAEARALFEAGLAQTGLRELGAPLALPGPQRTPMIIHLAREWGQASLADALRQAADDQYEPTWDHDRGEFTWGFRLDEEHPRGQFNAAMAAAEVMTEGAWRRLFDTSPGARFDEPTVRGIDFPDLTVIQAWWDAASGRLAVATAPRNDAVAGRPTRFTIANLGDARGWTVESHGPTPVSAQPAGGELVVATTIGSHRFVVRRGEATRSS